LLDIIMPGMDGLEVLERIKQRTTTPQVIMLTATKTVKTAVNAMKLGAFDYVTKPFDVEELLLIVERAVKSAALAREVEALRSEVGVRYKFDNIIGHSRKIQDVLGTVSMVAPLKTTVLITGESGTGKELIARAIHYNSPRTNGPLVTLNCAAIPESLLENELFGHERGAFTDAYTRQLGQFENANDGTLFLDEIGDMQPSTQAKILRVLEQGEFLRIGGTQAINVDVRVIAATSRDLHQGMRDGTFRSDSIIASTSWRFTSAAQERKTSCSCSTSWPRYRAGDSREEVHRRRSTCCSNTVGRATSASWTTSSSAHWFSQRARQ
jgi:DNA-binding NtrC family response regulator